MTAGLPTGLAAGTLLPVRDEALANILLPAGPGGRAGHGRRPAPRHRDLAAKHGLQLVAALETHLHADFVSGSSEFVDAGIQVFAADRAGLRFPHEPVSDGNRLPLGDCTVEVLATAGHTPEHLSFLLHPTPSSASATRRIARSRGKKRALVAVGRSILVIVWHLLSDPDVQFTTSAPTSTTPDSGPNAPSATTSSTWKPSATKSPANPPPDPPTNCKTCHGSAATLSPAR